MAPLTRRRTAVAAAASNLDNSHAATYADASPELLGLVFLYLPPVEQVMTVSRLSREWRAWSAPRAAALRASRAANPGEDIGYMKMAESAAPAFALREAWPRLGYRGRKTGALRAAYHGDLQTLTWLRDSTYALSDYGRGITAAAACGGHLTVLQFLRASGCKWDACACSAAAYGGHLEVLQFLHANGCPWDPIAHAAAARCGHLGIVQWLRTNGCPWDGYACHNAALGGHLEVLQWLVANGCPWSRLFPGRYSVEPRIRAWLVEQGLENPPTA